MLTASRNQAHQTALPMPLDFRFSIRVFGILAAERMTYRVYVALSVLWHSWFGVGKGIWTVIRPVPLSCGRFISATVTGKGLRYSQLTYIHLQTHTKQPFYGPFPGPPGWAGARRELLDFMVQGKINRGRHTDHPAGHHSIRTNQCPPLPSPLFFIGQMPFLSPNQQCQSTAGN